MLAPALLYIVATPIGNLEDVSLRALEVLRSVHVVASEDTRHTAKLLARHEIKARQMPFHEHNEARVVGKIVRLLQDGRDVALVSDAGTPGIADPGFSLVRRCHEEGLAVTMVPGPAAFVMAVVLSGLPVHSFTFRGFAPRKPGKRRRFLALDQRSPHTLVFYESPYRVRALLKDALEVYGDRQAALCNDLTKKFELVQRGRLSELVEVLGEGKIRGEYVVVIEGGEVEPEPEPERRRKGRGKGRRRAQAQADAESRDEADEREDELERDEDDELSRDEDEAEDEDEPERDEDDEHDERAADEPYEDEDEPGEDEDGAEDEDEPGEDEDGVEDEPYEDEDEDDGAEIEVPPDEGSSPDDPDERSRS